MIRVISRNLLKVFVGAVCVLAFFGLAQVANAEVITSLDTEITINEDASLSVTETIDYDFEEAERHGIYRDIPVRYETETANRRIFLSNITVRQDGEAAMYKESRQGDNVHIRIGDPDATITGEHTYEIRYLVRGALNFFENERAEVYWDVVGDSWEVSINEATADISLAQSGRTAPEDLEVRCFAGNVGAPGDCAQLEKTAQPLGLTARASNLSVGQGMTVVLNFPASLVEQPTALTSAWWFLQANPLTALPLLALIVSFLVWYRWGRDPKGRGVVVTQYEPPQDLKPILVGSLIDERVHSQDITAGILYLAEQGYIEIERVEKKWFLGDHDYILRQKQNFENITDEMYRHLAETLFTVGGPTSVLSIFSGNQTDEHKGEVRLSELKESQRFAKAIQEMKQDIMQDMCDHGWFEPRNNRAALLLGAFLVLPFLALFILGDGVSGVSVLGIFLSMLIAGGFLFLMKKKTKEGAVLQEDLKGFKRFLSMTQKERLEFHNAPERSPKEFMQYLPYAIALGVEEKWAAQFTGLDMPPPSWYHGTGAFVATDFASDLSEFSKSYNQAASGSSGTSGGSVGGGMGGGGGGSW